jgi:hypothetical protein
MKTYYCWYDWREKTVKVRSTFDAALNAGCGGEYHTVRARNIADATAKANKIPDLNDAALHDILVDSGMHPTDAAEMIGSDPQ